MDADDIHNEIRAVGKLCKRRHRNIVEVMSICKDVWKTIPAYFIQMELCDGDMDSYIQRRYELGEPIGALEVVDIMVQILDGLVFLHENDEVHRDLKPKNDLWTIAQTDHREPGQRIWKIADFGFMSPAISGNQVSSVQGRMTQGYHAPELDLRGNYSKKVDIWAIGCITYELATGKRAFRTVQDTRDYFWRRGDSDGTFKIRFDDAPQDECSALNLLVADCFAREPTARPDSRTVRYRFEQLRLSLETALALVKLGGDGFSKDENMANPRELIAALQSNDSGVMRGSENDDDANAAQIIYDRAAICLEQGRYTEAEKLYQWALGIREMKLGKEHQETGHTISGLATAYLCLGQYRKAQELYKRCIQIYENSPNNQDKAKAVSSLGTTSRMQGHYTEAENQYLLALKMFDKVKGKSDVDIAQTLSELGDNYGCQGKYELEVKMHERVWDIRTKSCENDHPDLANAIRALGVARHHQGKYEDAEAMCRWAFQMQEKILGKEHPDTLETLNHLGFVFVSRGRADEAETLLLSVLELQSKTLGKDHPRVAETLQHLGLAYKHQKQHEKERTAIEQALNIQERTLGEQHPQRAITLTDLGDALVLQRRYKEAEKIYVKALDIIERTFQQHPAMAKTLGGLGIALGSQGRHKEEEVMHDRALNISMATLGRTHPDTARAMYNLAVAYLNLKRYDEAQTHYQNALEVWGKTLGLEHPYLKLLRERVWAVPKKRGGLFKVRTK